MSSYATNTQRVDLRTCTHCFTDATLEFRDAHWLAAPRWAYGTWRVCPKCGREWPVTLPGDVMEAVGHDE